MMIFDSIKKWQINYVSQMDLKEKENYKISLEKQIQDKKNI